MTRMEVGTRLKLARKTWGFSQKQVADYLGIAQGQLSKLENGSRGLSDESIEKICLLYRINEEWLLYGEGESNLKCRLHLCNC